MSKLPNKRMMLNDLLESPYPVSINSLNDGDLDDTEPPNYRIIKLERDNDQHKRLGNETERTGPPVQRGLVIKELFVFCENVYQEVLPTIRKLMDTTDRTKWEENRGRFSLWGEGYGVLEGELDKLLLDVDSRYLRVSAVVPLCSIAKTLCASLSGVNGLVPQTIDQGLPNINFHATKRIAALHTLLEVVLGLVPEARDIIEPNWDDDDSASEFDLSDAAENLRDSLGSLFDIVPFIDHLYLATGSKPSIKEQRVSTVESVNDPPCSESQSYRKDILDTFPGMNEQLAENLAEINWTRHQRIREWARNYENQEKEAAAEINFIDSGLRNSIFNFEAPLNPTQRNPFSSCASTTSLGTKNPTMSGGIRIPKIPTPSSTGIKCCVCFKNLSGVNTKRLWKKHVLRDLQPYSCLFDSCSEKKNTFETKKAWVQHEFQYHRPQAEWRCSGGCAKVYQQRGDFVRHVLEDHLEWTVTASEIDNIVDRRKFKRRESGCPFCEEIISEDERLVKIHIGAHMDEIALKALPQDIETESDTSSEDGVSLGNTNQAIKGLKSRNSARGSETIIPPHTSPPLPTTYKDNSDSSTVSPYVQHRHRLPKYPVVGTAAQHLATKRILSQNRGLQNQEPPDVRSDPYTLVPGSATSTDSVFCTAKPRSDSVWNSVEKDYPFLLPSTPQSATLKEMSEGKGKDGPLTPRGRHRLIGRKGHICLDCGATFPIEERLKSHMALHTKFGYHFSEKKSQAKLRQLRPSPDISDTTPDISDTIADTSYLMPYILDTIPLISTISTDDNPPNPTWDGAYYPPWPKSFPSRVTSDYDADSILSPNIPQSDQKLSPGAASANRNDDNLKGPIYSQSDHNRLFVFGDDDIPIPSTEHLDSAYASGKIEPQKSEECTYASAEIEPQKSEERTYASAEIEPQESGGRTYASAE